MQNSMTCRACMEKFMLKIQNGWLKPQRSTEIDSFEKYGWEFQKTASTV